VVILHTIGKKALQIVKPNNLYFFVLFIFNYDKNFLHKIFCRNKHVQNLKHGI